MRKVYTAVIFITLTLYYTLPPVLMDDILGELIASTSLPHVAEGS